MARNLAVVGAGGAGAAQRTRSATRTQRHSVREEPRRLRARCDPAARRLSYEYGANYLKADDGRVTELVTRPSRLRDSSISRNRVRVDRTGDIGTGGMLSNTNGRRGRHSAVASGRQRSAADVENGVDGLRVERGATDVRMTTVRGRPRTLRRRVLTPPAPQTADLLGQSRWDHDDCRELRQEIAAVPYRTVIPACCTTPSNSTSRGTPRQHRQDHPVGWVAREECKDGHVPDGECLLLVQMNEPWSIANYDEHPDTLIDDIASRTARLLDDDRRPTPTGPTTSTGGSQPEGEVDHDLLSCAAEHDLHFAGDGWPARGAHARSRPVERRGNRRRR